MQKALKISSSLPFVTLVRVPPYWLHLFAWLLSHDPQDVYPVAQAFHILDNSDEKPVFTGSLHNLALHIFQCYHGFNEIVYICYGAYLRLYNQLCTCSFRFQLFPEGPSAKHVNVIFWGGWGEEAAQCLKNIDDGWIKVVPSKKKLIFFGCTPSLINRINK